MADDPMTRYPEDIASFLRKIGDELDKIPVEERAELHEMLEKSLRFWKATNKAQQENQPRQREWPRWIKWFWE